MAGYLGAIPVPQATQHRESFTATSGQTTFNTAGYTVGFLDVYLNGSHLSPADFTATNGSDVVLASGASAGDVCDIISYTAFEIADQTFTGTTTMDVAAITGVLTANGGAVFNEGSADVDFRVESNGDANMLFVDGGNNRVGIGTSSPSQPLHVSGSAPIIRLTDTDTGAYSEISASSSDGNLMFFADQGNTQGSSNIRFYVDGNHAGRFDPSGNLLVGKTSSSATTQGIEARNDGRLWVTTASDDSIFNRAGSDGGILSFRKAGTVVGSISITGSNTAYNTSSDYRLKTDAQPMTGASARVQALKPVNFEWISDGTRVDGFLAHEAQAVVPEAVTGTKDAMRDEEYEVTPAVLDADGNETKPAVMGTRSVPDLQGIDQSKMVPLLVAALQEALARITALENA